MILSPYMDRTEYPSTLVEQTRKEKSETTIKVTDSFISALLKYIVSDHDVIRETTTELAGSTLSPAVYCTPPSAYVLSVTNFSPPPPFSLTLKHTHTQPCCFTICTEKSTSSLVKKGRSNTSRAQPPLWIKRFRSSNTSWNCRKIPILQMI